MNVKVRAFNPKTTGEAEALFAIFVEAVHEGAKDHYTAARRQVWAPVTEMPEGWPDRLAGMET